MSWRKVRNWEKWQTYRTDRPVPPWIKIHRRVILDPDFVMLSDAEKAQLICIWILAADRNGWIKNDSKMIQRLAGLETEPDLKRLQVLGFIEKPRRHVDVNVAPNGRQDDAPEAKAKADPPTPPRRGAVDKSTKDKLNGNDKPRRNERKNENKIRSQIQNTRGPDQLMDVVKRLNLPDPPPGYDLTQAKTWLVAWVDKQERAH